MPKAQTARPRGSQRSAAQSDTDALARALYSPPGVTVSSSLSQPGAGRLENGSVIPLLSIGFRPFFLLAALSAVALVPSWLWALDRGNLSPYWAGAAWHAHEMLFGFTTAVIAGFLLTAASNWTKRRTATGSALALLAALWLAGRLAPLFIENPPLVALIDLAFIPALLLPLGRAVLGSRNRRNYGILLLLCGLFVANLAMHLEQLAMHGWAASWLPAAGSGQRWALRWIAAFILLIGGRVIPFFTRNATGDARIRPVRALDLTSFALFACAVVGEALALAAPLQAALWLAAGLSHLTRMVTWGTYRAAAPLLWILHFGYAATAAAFALEGLALLGAVPYTTALHTFTVGGIGALTLGMMARVSLGHSGRPLIVPRRVAFAFISLALSAVSRTVAPIWFPESLQHWWVASGILWTLAFALLLQFGLPIWFSARADQRSSQS